MLNFKISKVMETLMEEPGLLISKTTMKMKLIKMNSILIYQLARGQQWLTSCRACTKLSRTRDLIRTRTFPDSSRGTTKSSSRTSDGTETTMKTRRKKKWILTSRIIGWGRRATGETKDKAMKEEDGEKKMWIERRIWVRPKEQEVAYSGLARSMTIPPMTRDTFLTRAQSRSPLSKKRGMPKTTIIEKKKVIATLKETSKTIQRECLPSGRTISRLRTIKGSWREKRSRLLTFIRGSRSLAESRETMKSSSRNLKRLRETSMKSAMAIGINRVKKIDLCRGMWDVRTEIISKTSIACDRAMTEKSRKINMKKSTLNTIEITIGLKIKQPDSKLI